MYGCGSMSVIMGMGKILHPDAGINRTRWGCAEKVHCVRGRFMRHDLKFKKESAIARMGMSLEGLLSSKARSEARLEIMRGSQIFHPSDIRYVEASIGDLGRRIRARRVQIARKARRACLKQASHFCGTTD